MRKPPTGRRYLLRSCRRHMLDNSRFCTSVSRTPKATSWAPAWTSAEQPQRVFTREAADLRLHLAVNPRPARLTAGDFSANRAGRLADASPGRWWAARSLTALCQADQSRYSRTQKTRSEREPGPLHLILEGGHLLPIGQILSGEFTPLQKPSSQEPEEKLPSVHRTAHTCKGRRFYGRLKVHVSPAATMPTEALGGTTTPMIRFEPALRCEPVPAATINRGGRTAPQGIAERPPAWAHRMVG